MTVIARNETLLRLIRHGIEALRDGDGDALTARATMANLDQLVSNHRGAVSLSAEELHCLICAMAGNFPERFQPIRMDLLRKLAKAQRAAGGQ